MLRSWHGFGQVTDLLTGVEYMGGGAAGWRKRPVRQGVTEAWASAEALRDA